MNTSDKELLASIYERKDEKAFKLFYDRYAKLLLNWAAKRTGQREIAADIVQNFWVIFWSKPYAIKTDANGVARKYLIHYFAYRMFDYMRTSASKALGNEALLEMVSQSDSYSHVIEEIEVNEILEIIDNVLEGFPELSQQIFRAIWENNASVKETSLQFGLSEKVIRTHHKKVMDVVQTQVKSLMQDEELKAPETMLKIAILLGLLH